MIVRPQSITPHGMWSSHETMARAINPKPTAARTTSQSGAPSFLDISFAPGVELRMIRLRRPARHDYAASLSRQLEGQA